MPERTKRKAVLTFVALLLFLPFATAWGADFYVSPTGNDSTGNGQPATPFATIQYAIGTAVAGDTVRVAAGTYNENITMKSGVNVIGNSNNPLTTMILGAASGAGVVNFNNIQNAILNGFTISVSTPDAGVDRAVVFDGSTDRSATLSNCIIIGTQYGIFVFSPSAPTIQNNTLFGNGTEEQGIYIGNAATSPVVRNNIITGYFWGIHVVAGTAMPQPVIEYNDVWGNSGGDYHGPDYPSQTGVNGNISVDPVLNAAYKPNPDSPCIDAGDPAPQFRDADGTRNDMGAYGMNYPVPQLELKSVETTGELTTYNLTVVNRAQFSDELFTAAPSLPPCGENNNSSRTWVDIYLGDNVEPYYGFCALVSNEGLDTIWFKIFTDQPPPPSVYIVLWDRQLNVKYTSNLLTITDSDRDGVPDSSDNCPADYNPDQADGDGDGVGNLCDNCPTISNPPPAPGAGQADVCSAYSSGATGTLSPVLVQGCFTFTADLTKEYVVRPTCANTVWELTGPNSETLEPLGCVNGPAVGIPDDLVPVKDIDGNPIPYCTEPCNLLDRFLPELLTPAEQTVTYEARGIFTTLVQCPSGETIPGFGSDDVCPEILMVSVASDPVTVTILPEKNRLIDVYPGTYPNLINPGATGSTPVAIIGSPTFDVTKVDLASILMAGAPVASYTDKKTKKKVYLSSTKDFNGDGYLDLIVHFVTSQLNISYGDTTITLTGNNDGVPFTGEDSIQVVRGSKK